MRIASLLLVLACIAPCVACGNTQDAEAIQSENAQIRAELARERERAQYLADLLAQGVGDLERVRDALRRALAKIDRLEAIIRDWE